MADGAGGAASPAPAGSNQGRPSPPPPSLDGAFLLQLLQKPPQPAARPSASASTSLPQHHFDPAVAAVGPIHPFLVHDPRHPPPPLPGHFQEPLLLPSPAFSLPPGIFPPPGFLAVGCGDVVSSGGPGNHPFLPFDQRLGFPASGVHTLSASPPRGDLVRNHGQLPIDKILPDQMIARKNVSGPQSQKDRSSLRTPPGFQKLQDGRATEIDRGSVSSSGSDSRLTRNHWKMQPERSSGFVQGNHLNRSERERNTAFHRSTLNAAPPRLPDLVEQQQQPDRLAAARNDSCKPRSSSQKEDDHASLPPTSDVALRRATPSRIHQNKNKYSPDGNERRKSPLVGNKDTEESDQDSEYEILKEENKNNMQELEIKDQSLTVSYSSKSKISGEEESESYSAMLMFDSEVKSVETHTSSSRSKKDIRSDLFRGHHVSNQRTRIRKRTIRCRHDIESLSSNFLSIFQSLEPADEEKAKQKQLLLSLQSLVNKEWPNAKMYLYGSCANTFGVSRSDVDVCLAIDGLILSKSEILLKLAEILESGNLQNVQALTHARVPIVKLMDPVTGLSCDICVNNLLAVVNTKLLKDYAQIDERLRQLAFIVKHWARSRRVNETYQGTLSSYAYVLMCIHFLQLRRPAILPCLQAMDATYNVTVDNTLCTFFDQVERLRGFGARNTESIARLLWAFFQYWAYHHDYTNDVISIRTGSIVSKQAKDWTRRIGNDRHLICIEDPFDTSHDLGRVVDKFSIKILREEFERAADILQYDPNPSVTLFEPYVPGSPQT